ncbi:MAG: T9SS type A sorting domain-containing protein [Cyclobacteriaceae bacterium]
MINPIAMLPSIISKCPFKAFGLFISFLSFFNSHAQTIVNAYARVSEISGSTLYINNVNEVNDTFAEGENILIFQMQDDVIGSNTNDDSSFGNISDIGSAGLYEQATIETITPAGGTENIWVEDFEDLAYGTDVDNGSTAWSSACAAASPCGNLVVTNGSGQGLTRVLAGNNLGNIIRWSSEVIDISRHSDVDLSVFLAQLGYSDNNDFVIATYIVDGGSEYYFTNNAIQQGNFTATTATTNDLNGSTVQIFVYLMNDAGGEYGGFDDITVSGDQLGTIELSESLTNTFTTGENSSVQIVTFPQYASLTTSANMTAIPWDGNVGGILAIDVTGTLTLQNDISVDAQGFRGGQPNVTSNGDGCDADTYISQSFTRGSKGEGIHRTTNVSYTQARGKIASGGGGGNTHNAGGGGGGNFTAGGLGGTGYSGGATGCNPTAGGLGGVDLSDYVSSFRLFMGGGGGGGQENNNVATAGTNGGGIIIIRAGTIQTNGGCGGLTISANGGDAADSGNDGGGGAGAGGSIIFETTDWDLSCQLDIEAFGGDGGSVGGSGTAHGGGGGGGRGVIVFAGAQPGANLSTDNSQGTGGANDTSGNGGVADEGSSNPSNPEADPDGVVESSPGPLPVELLEWGGENRGSYNLLTWKTGSESNNDYFTLERSLDGKYWTKIALIDGNGSTTDQNTYQHRDQGVLGTLYYRLSQTDFDGTTEVFEIISIRILASPSETELFPNPTNGRFSLQFANTTEVELMIVKIYNSRGQEIDVPFEIDHQKINYDLTGHASGIYFVQIYDGNNIQIINLSLR